MMLMQGDISRRRGFAGRLLVGAAALAVLGTTATLMPSGVVRAQAADAPPPLAPPEAPAAHKETKHYLAWRDAVASMMAEPRTSVKFTNLFPSDSEW